MRLKRPIWVTLGGRRPVEATLGLSYMLLLLAIVFGWFMVTEQRELSPRVRAHVPASPLLALLVAPLLPGRDRGYGCFLLSVCVPAAAVAFGIGAPSGLGATIMDGFLPVFWLTLGYGCIYLSIGRALRHRLPNTIGGNHAARILLPMTVVAFILLPILVDVFLHGEPDDWHWGHAMNPFWTIAHFESGWRSAPKSVPIEFWGLVVIAVALQLQSCIHGVREVLAASATRRARQAPAPAP